MINRIEKIAVNKEKTHTYQPPEDLRRFVEVLLSEDVKGNKKLASELTHVRREKFYAHYRRNADFRAWVSEQCDMLLGHYEVIAGYSLLSALLQKDVMAIRTYYELRGKLKHIIKSEGTAVQVNVPTNVYFISGKDTTKGDNGPTSGDGAGVQRGTEADRSV
jgi:hypothetical protein